MSLENVISKSTIENWIDAQTTLKAVKEEEMELRKEICNELQENEGGIGTKNYLVHGFKLKATFALTYKIDEEKLTELMDQLSDAEKACIKWKPSLDVTAFKKIESDLLNEIVFATMGAPTLKVVSDASDN